MYSNDITLFNELATKCGNRYLAVKFVSTIARDLGHEAKGVVIESKLITWALTGKCPYTKDELEYRQQHDSDVAELEDYLCYVSDEAIANQVRKYYKISLRNRHLTLDESNVLDKYYQMRTNIILRMAWYGFDT